MAQLVSKLKARMDRWSLKYSLLPKKKRTALFGSLLSVSGTSFWWFKVRPKQAHLLVSGAGHSAAHENGHKSAPQGSLISRSIGLIENAFEQVQEKVRHFEGLERENELLRAENAHLRVEMESKRFTELTAESKSKTEGMSHQLKKEAGSHGARDLASIDYEVPHQLAPHQLYALGVSYFKAREDEKAAVILGTLTDLETTDAYKTPKNYLLTGIAFYRLENFTKADSYFDKVLKSEPVEANLPSHAQARLWKSIVAHRLGKHAKVQFWLTELVDHHPHSTEASWINPAARKPASHSETKAHPEPHPVKGEESHSHEKAPSHH